MDCRVVVEAAVPVYDVETADEAVRIAISKTGEMLNPDLNYVEINMGERSCPHCGEETEPAFIAADESLVALELEMSVFNVERDEHAARIARKEIGQQLEDVPLEVLEVEVVEEDDDGDDEDGEGDGSSEVPREADEGAPDGDDAPVGDESSGAQDDDADDLDAGSEGESDEEDLPEFEDLMDE